MNSSEDKVISISLKVSDWNYILQSLLELPAKISNPINNSIVAQATEQLKDMEQLKAMEEK